MEINIIITTNNIYLAHIILRNEHVFCHEIAMNKSFLREVVEPKKNVFTVFHQSRD